VCYKAVGVQGHHAAGPMSCNCIVQSNTLELAHLCTKDCHVKGLDHLTLTNLHTAPADHV
jgi:hypothetical protein